MPLNTSGGYRLRGLPEHLAQPGRALRGRRGLHDLRHRRVVLHTGACQLEPDEVRRSTRAHLWPFAPPARNRRSGRRETNRRRGGSRRGSCRSRRRPARRVVRAAPWRPGRVQNSRSRVDPVPPWCSRCQPPSAAVTTTGWPGQSKYAAVLDPPWNATTTAFGSSASATRPDIGTPSTRTTRGRVSLTRRSA